MVPGFSQADLSLAAETNTGAAVGRALHPDAARPTGFDYTLGDGGLVLGSPMIGKMTLDPAEELDPVLDLGCPADENGVVLEDWRSAMKVSSRSICLSSLWTLIGDRHMIVRDANPPLDGIPNFYLPIG